LQKSQSISTDKHILPRRFRLRAGALQKSGGMLLLLSGCCPRIRLGERDL
jgi:hypothetical protein